MRRSSLAASVVLLLTQSVVLMLADERPPLAVAPFDAAQASEFQQRWADHVGKELVHTNSIGMNMVLLPPGEFMMGRTKEELDKLLEKPDEELAKSVRARWMNLSRDDENALRDLELEETPEGVQVAKLVAIHLYMKSRVAQYEKEVSDLA